MRQIEVNIPNNSYNIYIEKGLINKVEELIGTVYNGKKVFVITDNNVNEICGKRVENILSKSFDVIKIVIQSGEESKSLKCLESIYEKLIEENITRKDLIISLGGGVVGDLAGMAASTILRGVPFVQIPTTLLSQVDSSVGGKVGINLAQGKNLVGAFYQPKLVIIDPETLRTLPDRVLADGMAEVIKYGLIQDKELFQLLCKEKTIENLFDELDDIIYTCCKIKANVVSEDECETNIRAILNFGHTYGHGIEKYFEYEKYTHGEAVGLGMIMEAKLGEKLGVTGKGTVAKIIEILKAYDLPTEIGVEASDIYEFVKRDKKIVDSKIKIILLKEIGECVIHKLDLEELMQN